MYKILFRNRWFALGWVVLTLVGVFAFFGKGGGHESVEKAATQIADAKNPDTGFSSEQEQEFDFVSSESELGDETEEGTSSKRNDKSITLGRPGLADAAQEGEDTADTYVVLDEGAVIEEE